ncbi:hypothetical protein GGX14DRAFT_424170 [Mycena pura]|uniref:Lipid droplet-associated perilipin protein n=1 Tax=Mycena pura TaxID=153505 RepID=A0AAD6YMM1_9AGAR|nr:hypothetical protein GGX14DRAFT_424170 [Mycena pura]
MSTTSSKQMPSSGPPKLTIFNRVAEIPIIAYTIHTVSTTLSENRYTSPGYSAAKGISASAYEYSTPIQARLAPLMVSVDGYANRVVDVFQSKYPYPFEAKPDEVATYVRERSQSASEFIAGRRQSASETLEKRVTAPARSAVCSIDQRFTPIVDLLENTAVERLHTSAAPADTQYQYQRVYFLSKNVTSQLYEYSNQTVLAQRASQTAGSIAEFMHTAHNRVDAISNSLICELQNLQASLTATGAAASNEVGETISTLRSIVATPNLPVSEKVTKFSAEVQWRLTPLLERLLGGSARRSAPEGGTANGHAQ